MLEEHYISGVSIYENWNWKRECFIKLCYKCGHIWISTSDKTNCPCCFSNYYYPVPFRDCPQFSMEWLKKNFCKYIEELLNNAGRNTKK